MTPEIEIDENYTKMAIAGTTIVQISPLQNDLRVEWMD